MTLPIEWIFPLNEERLESGDATQIGEYTKELVITLTDMYQNIGQIINGEIRSFTPQVFGTTSAGAGTYNVQDGWYLRKGLMVDYWFAIQWSAHTGTGHVYVQLPYKVKKTLNYPFNGEVHGEYGYGGGYTGMYSLAPGDTFQNLIYLEGPSLGIFQASLLTNGTFFGHIRYIGQQIEN